MPVTESPRQVLTINAATVVVADTEAGLVDGTGFSCVTTAAAFTPSANLQEVPATGCAPKSQTAAASSWVVDLAWLQDPTSVGGGLTGYAFENDAQKRWISVEPTDPTSPKVVAEVTIVAGAIYGPFGSVLTTAAQWPVNGKPQITWPVAGAAAAAELVDVDDVA